MVASGTGDGDRDRVESDYYGFMAFDPELSKKAVGYYARWFEGQEPVVELACGRGEFLDVMREQGTAAYGVDQDPGMAQLATERGLRVVAGNAVEHLHSVEPGSVGGVFAAHFLEHLDPDAVQRTLAGARRALRPGGVLVAAVPNPACYAVLGHDFWTDPTHVRLYDPRLIAFFCTRAGLTVEEVGGNPTNTGGIPPGMLCPPPVVDPPLAEALVESLKTLDNGARRKWRVRESPWYGLGHIVSLLDERLGRTQHELHRVYEAYSRLLEELYQANEVYVVARG